MAVRTLQLEDIGDVVDRACTAFLRLQALRRALQEELDHARLLRSPGSRKIWRSTRWTPYSSGGKVLW